MKLSGMIICVAVLAIGVSGALNTEPLATKIFVLCVAALGVLLVLAGIAMKS